MLISPGALHIVSVLSTDLKEEKKRHWLLPPLGLFQEPLGERTGGFRVSVTRSLVPPRRVPGASGPGAPVEGTSPPPAAAAVNQHLVATCSPGPYLCGQPSAFIIFEPIFKSWKS